MLMNHNRSTATIHPPFVRGCFAACAMALAMRLLGGHIGCQEV
jgi:hypothetical protein